MIDLTQWAADPVGLEISHGGQRYAVIGVEPYRRVDGGYTRLIVWQSRCADCGAEFITRSPLKFAGLSRRCQTHKAPGRRARTGSPVVVAEPSP